MKAEYKEVHRRADRLQHRFGSIADDPNHPAMRSLQRQMRDVMEAIESDKAPKAIDDRVKAVIATLNQIGNLEAQVMSYSDNDSLRNEYEDFRKDIRELPNY